MSLQDRDKAVIWHPYTHFKSSPEPIAIIKGEGVYLIDENNKSYIDAISSWWVNLHGHGHPYIAEKIYQQASILEHVIFAGFTHQPAIELAERLLPLLPGNFCKVFYSDNGSTATEIAIKMALQFWWNQDNSDFSDASRKPARKKILAFNNGYHGDTFGAMSVSDRGVFTRAFHEHLFEVQFIDTPTEHNIGNLIEHVKGHAHEIAAFIYEPLLQAAGGMKMYDATLLNELLIVVKQLGILCIADEVMTGFGRTGKLFASGHLDAKPDIICLSKGLTGGTMALGLTSVNQKIVDAFVSEDKMKTFFHGHSFTANPLACTAALASLDLLLLPEASDRIGAIISANEQFLVRLQAGHHAYNIKNSRLLGTVLAFEINQGDDQYLNGISQIITLKGMEKGIYLRPLGNTVYLLPPYCITPEQLQLVYSVIIDIIVDIKSHPND